MDTLIVAANVLKVALGLGLVIFLHELGHFLLAKWNGVKVEKFSIGFGPTLASYRSGVGLRIGTGSRAPVAGDPPSWGETEYILAALPLGGYVKMLGEATEDAKDQEKSTDPRAYHNKSVFARMGIITAGVIMNVFLGIACFAFVRSQGGEEMPAVIGGVIPGGPAYAAGLRTGDDIVAIDGRRDVAFKHLTSKVSLSGTKQVVKFTVKRPGVDGELTFGIEPRRDLGSNAPTIGIVSAKSLGLAPGIPFEAQPGMLVPESPAKLGLVEGDKVVAIGAEGEPLEPVADQNVLDAKLDALRDRPIVVAVERKDPKDEKAAPSRVEVKIPVHPFYDFGFRLTPGPVAAIRPDSPASHAGVKAGDRIVAVDGARDYDPMQLPDLARDHAGKPMILTVDRGGSAPIDLTITPDASPTWFDPFVPIIRPDPLDIPGFGLALAIEPKVASVIEGSPASKAQIKPGEVIRSLVMTLAPGEKVTSRSKPVTFQIDEKSNAWPMAYAAVQEIPWTSIELTTDRSPKPFAVKPELDLKRFHPLRGLNFAALTRPTPPVGFVEAIRLGIEETSETAWSILSIFSRLAERRISGFAFGGMIPIAQIAYTSASTGLITFIHFLGVISVNLAVLNFMPIPPLDGGQFLFLAGEKIRGKPLPDSLLNFVTIGGVIFVLGLILVINVKDVVLLVQSYF